MATTEHSTVEQSIVVDVPVRTAYNQWTQFEEFPQFMEGVKEVRQLDDTRLYWRANIGGVEKEWRARIIEQVPDQRIVWQSEGGAYNRGVVTFLPEESDHTRITLRIAYDPEGVLENVGDAVGAVSRRVKGDLERFQEFIEARGRETGAWRGTVEAGTKRPSAGFRPDDPVRGRSGQGPGCH